MRRGSGASRCLAPCWRCRGTRCAAIHTHEVRASPPLARHVGGSALAARITVANIAVMGLVRRDRVPAHRARVRASAGDSARSRSAGATSSRSARSPDRRSASGSIAQRGDRQSGLAHRHRLRGHRVHLRACRLDGGGAGGCRGLGGGLVALGGVALALVLIAARGSDARSRNGSTGSPGPAAASARTLEIALIGWLDWLLAAVVFVACLRATGRDGARSLDLATDFFFGQVIGLASLVPGGFGSSDAFWIARLPFDQNVDRGGARRVSVHLLHRARGSLASHGAALVGDAASLATHRRRAAHHRPAWSAEAAC